MDIKINIQFNDILHYMQAAEELFGNGADKKAFVLDQISKIGIFSDADMKIISSFIDVAISIIKGKSRFKLRTRDPPRLKPRGS